MVVEIKDLLSRFNDLLLKSEGRNIFIQEAVLKATNIKIKNEDIKIKNNIIYLDIKPIYKNKIFLKKEEIFKNLEFSLGKKIPEGFR